MINVESKQIINTTFDTFNFNEVCFGKPKLLEDRKMVELLDSEDKKKN